HSRRPPGSRAALGEDATVAWNYVDLRFVGASAWRLEVELDAEQLIVGVRTERRRRSIPVVHERRQPSGERGGARRSRGWSGDAGSSCLSCEQPCEFARHPGDAAARIRNRRAWLLDGVWPEYAEYLRAHARADDRLAIPIDGERLRVGRYAW